MHTEAVTIEGAPKPADIRRLEDELEAAERDARELVDGLGEQQGEWCAEPGSWSVAHCLDHIATGNRVYLAAMRPEAERASAEGRRRKGAAKPGLIGGLFVWQLEPPVTAWFKMRAPRTIRPRPAPRLCDAFAAFAVEQREVPSCASTRGWISPAFGFPIRSSAACASASRRAST